MTPSDFGASTGGAARPLFWHGVGGLALFVLGWVVSQSASAGAVDATLKAQAEQIDDLKITLAAAIQEQSHTNTEVAEGLAALKTEVSNLKDTIQAGRRAGAAR